MYWLTIVFAVFFFFFFFLVFYFHCTSDGKFHDPFFFQERFLVVSIVNILIVIMTIIKIIQLLLLWSSSLMHRISNFPFQETGSKHGTLLNP